MKFNKREKEMVNALRWLNKFNLGDMYEERIQLTLCKVADAHSFNQRQRFIVPHYKCYYCGAKKKGSI